MKKIPILLLIFITFVTSCSPTSKKGVQLETPKPGYPAPVEDQSITNPGYPVPQQSATHIAPSSSTATQDANLGQVKGTFLIENQTIKNSALYLAKVVKAPDDTEIVVGFSRTESIPTDPDKNGNFVFVNVPPGRYGLVYDQISDAFLMDWPNKDQSLVITVEAGKTIDLGKLNYEKPPSH